MMLSSLQRCLVLRKSNHPPKDDNMGAVPKLPALSAIFLAKTVWILAKPEDPLYGAINKYFLKIEHAHGTFDDFDRLPAFIALFCSAADEPGQDRRERMWALHLLKDGFIDPYCYRMVRACHAPEMLLTSLTSMSSRPPNAENDKERVALLDVVERLLMFGGIHAAHHLIGRMGLLSWIYSFTAMDDIDKCLPSFTSKVSFLRMTTRAMKQAGVLVSSNHDALVAAEVRNVLVAVLRVVVEGNVSRSSLESKQMIPMVCEAVCCAIETWNKVTPEAASGRIVPFHSTGIPLVSVCKLISLVAEEDKQRLVHCLCRAPLCGDESDSVDFFCRFVLSTIQQSQPLPTNVLYLLLEQATELVKSCDEKNPAWSDNLIQQWLSCRQRCMVSNDCCCLWVECLELLTNHSASNDASGMIGAARESLGILKTYNAERGTAGPTHLRLCDSEKLI